MIDQLVALIVYEGRWLTASIGSAVLAVTVSHCRHFHSQFNERRRRLEREALGPAMKGANIIACHALTLVLLAGCNERAIPGGARPAEAPTTPAVVEPNDNRTPAGEVREERYTVRLRAIPAQWRPEGDAGPSVRVFAFAEDGGPARLPGPLIRVKEGQTVTVSIVNSVPPGEFVGLPPPNRRTAETVSVTGSELLVHGLTSASRSDDTLRVPFGETREATFTADRPGIFPYWASATSRSLRENTGPDSQLAGALVVDPAATEPDPDERIFVITMIDAFPDPSRTPPGDDVFEPAINGLGWPHTERLSYRVHETVRWRWVNASGFEHPMHLHGFHFRATATGDPDGEVFPEPDEVRTVVTEHMQPGSTFRMEWKPTRPGNWLMHCHIRDHVIPAPERDAESRGHDMHDVTRHPLEAMAGLVMGITVSDDGPPEADGVPVKHLRLIARQAPAAGGAAPARGFSLDRGAPSAVAGMTVPGPPIVLTRGATTRITVRNEMDEPTSVHWHGLELQSVYDGVAGWSRTGNRVAPLVGPGDTFDVYLAPPRAGTFMYHSHMDETTQLTSGMYGPIIVLDPGETFDPVTDRIFVIGHAHDGEYWGVTVNGRKEPLALRLRAGTRYRFRVINISEGDTVNVSLEREGKPLTWIPRAKDGADLPAPLQAEAIARLRTGAGETFDFFHTPAEPMQATLKFDWVFPTEVGNLILLQPIIVE